MGNRGFITVFLTLMISVILILVVTVYTLADLSCAKGRTAAAVRSSMSGVRAEYSRYLFDHYHVLFLNQNPHGEGVGGLEEEMENRLADNLGDEYTVKDVAVTGATGVLDNNAAEFRKQVAAAAPYLLADNPELTTREALDLSAQMMDGEKMNAFVLDLSFILWDILSAATLGIAGILWVNPYEDATNAELYTALKAKGRSYYEG